MKTWLKHRPWIWIVLFFTGYVLAWTWLIFFAVDHTPETVPLETAPTAHHES